MRPEEQAGHSFEHTLSRVVVRAGIAHWLYGLAAGVATAALSGVAGAAGVANAAAAIVAGAVVFATRQRRTRRHAAILVERVTPQSRNAIITAEELIRHPERARAPMRARVAEDAGRLTAAVRPSAARPIHVPVILFLATTGAALILPRATDRAIAIFDMAPAAAQDADAVALTVVVAPPFYTQRPATREIDPEHIDALAGSTARLSIGGDPRQWRLRFGRRDVAWSADGTAVMPLTESGYFALEPAAGTLTGARLVPVIVRPDRAPVVRIDAPARDLVVADASRIIGVTTTASDDLALESLQLRYTKVSGTGEDFEFVEGTLPIALVRTSVHTWRGSARVSLGSLRLEPGDSLVYRAVAKDRRPGAQGEASSDTFFIEVAGPGQVALEGFELPPEQERYALSQQMVVLKIERLRARERSISREALEDSTAAIAAEQRAVRANFIFLMGGHVEDEEVEAEQSNEIQEGRLENTARREISTAVHLMTRAEQGLMSVSTAAALPPAKSAVDALQRAFGRNRYILRTPPYRSAIDPGRRLGGNLSAAAIWRRDRFAPVRDSKVERTEAFVEAALGVARRLTAGDAPEGAWFGALAEQALAIDPAAREWQETAARLSSLRERAGTGSPATDLLGPLNEAVKPALDETQSASRPPGTSRQSALGRAWAQESKR